MEKALVVLCFIEIGLVALLLVMLLPLSLTLSYVVEYIMYALVFLTVAVLVAGIVIACILVASGEIELGTVRPTMVPVPLIIH